MTFSNLTCDDRCVVQINGTTVGNAGISAPGNGSMSLDGSAATSFTFTTANDDSTPIVINSGLNVGGSNTLRLIVNNTGSGISGALQDFGPADNTAVRITATLTYNGGAPSVPIPSTSVLSSMGLLFLAGTYWFMRHRQTV